MASKVTETIKVLELSKFGFKAVDGTYINWGPRLDDAIKGKVVPGNSYTFELYVADSGKKYVNNVLATVPPKVAPKPVVKPVVKVAPKVSEANNEAMTKAEWGEKDLRISKQGALQVAVQVTGGNFEEAVKLAQQMVEWVWKK